MTISSLNDDKTMQVALNLDLAGVESFVKERLGKEVSVPLLKDILPRCFLILEFFYNIITFNMRVFYLVPRG